MNEWPCEFHFTSEFHCTSAWNSGDLTGSGGVLSRPPFKKHSSKIMMSELVHGTERSYELNWASVMSVGLPVIIAS